MVVGVYGLGRFGSFWASVLARHFPVKGYSRTAERQVPSGVERASEDEVLQCDVLFLAVAISAMDEVLRRIGPKIGNGTIVFDTCSVKMYPIELMKKHLAPQVQVIGTHPMFGPDSGRNGVEGLPIVFCPVRVGEAKAEEWRQLFRSMGLQVKDLTAEEHDREVAFTQGITHFIGRVLEDLNLHPSEIATIGYAKLLEIIEQTCNDPWQLFVDLQRFNPYTADMRVALFTSLKKIKESLESSLDSDAETASNAADAQKVRGRSR